MTLNQPLFSVHVAKVTAPRRFWLEQPWVGIKTANAIRDSDILILPAQTALDPLSAAFSPETKAIVDAFRARLGHERVAIAVEPHYYQELVLHAHKLRFPKFIVTAILLPLAVTVVADRIDAHLDRQSQKDGTVELEIIVETVDGSGIEIRYEGPANDLVPTIMEQAARFAQADPSGPRHAAPAASRTSRSDQTHD